MEKIPILREILAKNIRSARTSLHISQAKLAEYASISVPHMLDIEYCKTWVSDKTLNNIAKALNMEAYELLLPEKARTNSESGKRKTALHQTTEVISAKKRELRKKMSEAMDELVFKVIKIHGGQALLAQSK